MRILYKIIIRCRKIFLYNILNITTVGVRVVLKNKDKVLLIKHPYDDFWVLPGGGVKNKEKIIDSAIRETKEETRYEIKKPIIRVGKYKNFFNGKKDFVYVYLAENFSKPSLLNKKLSVEIEKIKWFKINNLPKTSAATKRRLAEVFEKDFRTETRNW